MLNRRHRWLRRFAAGLAFAALAVPTAQAGIAEDSGIGAESNVASQHSGYEADSSGIGGSPGVPLQKSGIAGLADNGYMLKDGMWVKATQPYSGSFDRGAYPSDVSVRPDDRAVRITPPPVDATSVARPDDRGERFTPSGGELPQVVAEPATGFDWDDAGIGAGAAVGLMLLALGAALATRHASRKTLAGA